MIVAWMVVATPLAADDASNVRFAPAGPAAATTTEPALVDTPQHAVVFLSPTDTRHIWLVRLLPKEAVYKNADHDEQEQTLTARPNLKVALKLLSGDVFRIDPRSRRFNRFDELTGRFAPLRASGIQAGSQSSHGMGGDASDGHGEIHTEIAEGTGTDPAAALADAFRNAVRRAVGVYVDSETLTDKEAVISDKVLTFSDAFVARYEELSRSTEDGLITIRISAAIQAGKLMTNLREARVNTLDLVGGDLVAAAVTRKEAKDAAADLLHKKFLELPGTLAAEALPFKPLDYDLKKQLLTITYTLHADREKYAAFLASLEPLVSQVALAKTSIVVKVEPIWSDNAAPIWQDDSTKKRAVAAQTAYTPGFRYGPNLANLADTWCLWLMTRWDANHRNTQWQGFALDVDLPRTLGTFSGSVAVKLELVDAQGEVVKEETHDPLDGLSGSAYWFGWARPRPRVFIESRPKSWPAPAAYPSAPILLVSFAEPRFAIDAGTAVNAYVCPMCYTMSGAGVGTAILTPGVWRVSQLAIAPDDLARVKAIRATPVFVPPAAASSEPTRAQTASPSASSPTPLPQEPKP